MRIGVYDPYLNDLGGGEKYMMSLASVLAKNHRVDVFWDNPEDFPRLTKQFGIDFQNIHITKNIFAHTVSLIKRFLQSKKYDVIIFLSDGSIPLIGSKKLLLHIQQPLGNMQLYSFWNQFKFHRVTGFFVNSNYTKQYIERNFSIKPAVVYPPVALFPKNVTKKNIILHVGRFRLIDPLTHAGDFKKQHVMIDRFKKMIDKGLREWMFILAVSVMDKEQNDFLDLKKKTKGYPIEFLINRTNDELWDIYSKSKIYWHASGYGEDLEKHPEYAEHFGISTVEAMGAGAVPVVINAGGQKEIVEDGKNGILWNTLEELQNKTMQLIENKKLLEKLSKAAMIRAQDFSYEKFANSVNNLVS